MPRYADWFRKVGDAAASPRALDAAKKLLGYLNIRRGTPGVDTLVQKVTLDDGTVVTAAFYGDQPTVTVDTSAVGGETCTLYVESGMLDLGPNIAADAGNRFNRGMPEFDDRPATLYFGDGVDCPDGQGGFNGKVKIRGRKVTSECLPKQGASVESRLRDPVKKQAQAMLPASCWSGLMQRYVQAVYGGDALEYSGSNDTITVAGQDFTVSDSWGMVILGGRPVFVNIDNSVAKFYSVRPKSQCFASVLDAWAAMPSETDTDIAVRDKVFTVALSGCARGKEIGTATGIPTGGRNFDDRAAWSFDVKTPRATAVLGADNVASVHVVTFSYSDDVGFGVSTATIDAQPCGAIDARLTVNASSCYAASTAVSGMPLARATYEADYDFPIFAAFDASGAVEVTKYTLIAQKMVDAGIPGCVLDAAYPTGTGFPFVSQVDTSHQIYYAGQIITIAEGYHGTGWSSVVECKCYRERGHDWISWTGGNVTAVASGFDEKTMTESNLGATLTAFAGVPCIFSGVHVYSAYPYSYTFGYRGAYCNADYSSTIDTSMEVDCGGEMYGGAVTFSRSPADSEFADTCNRKNIYNNDAAVVSATGTWKGFQSVDFMAFTGGETVLGHASIISFPWGSQNDFVSERYGLVGGRGGVFGLQRLDALTVGGIDAGRRKDSISATITRSYEVHTAWASRPDLFCYTPGTLPPGWTFSDYDTSTVTQTDTVSTSSPIQQSTISGFSFVPPPTDTSTIVFRTTDTGGVIGAWCSAGATRGVESYGAFTSWGQRLDELRGVAFGDQHVSGSTTGFYIDTDTPISDANKAILGLFGMLLPMPATDPIRTTLADGLARWLDKGYNVIIDNFAYAASTSLLGAMIRPTLVLDRGNSINMDRETITGGYPKVSTPSFVGWA